MDTSSLHVAEHLRAHTNLETAYARLKDAASRIEALTRLTERQRLARALHDTLTQDLVGLIRQLEVADSHQSRHHYQRAQEIIQQATQRARLALTEARSAIAELREEPLSASDLKRAVQEEIHRFTQATALPCMADLDALLELPFPLREPALRLIAEGLQNVARHAQAQRVWVRVERVKQRLTLEVRDDGRGFDPSAVEVQAGHYGLLGLQERTRLVGGSLEINSTAGAGTVLRLHLPDPVKGATK
jgi:NarL family two-component system sensor histidine kinase YdfH